MIHNPLTIFPMTAENDENRSGVSQLIIIPCLFLLIAAIFHYLYSLCRDLKKTVSDIRFVRNFVKIVFLEVLAQSVLVTLIKPMIFTKSLVIRKP